MKIKDMQLFGLSLIFFIAFAVTFWYTAYIYSSGRYDTISAAASVISAVAAVALLDHAVETN